MNDAVQPTLLLVEDNPSDLELTLRALRRLDLTMRIQVARDGAEAIDFLRGEGAWAGQQPGSALRAIFMDLKLPKLDGLDVLRRIRADPRTRMLPVIVLTSSRELRDVRACYGDGVNSYIVKPVQSEDFTAAVRLAGSYWLGVNHPPAWEG